MRRQVIERGCKRTKRPPRGGPLRAFSQLYPFNLLIAKTKPGKDAGAKAYDVRRAPRTPPGAVLQPSPAAGVVAAERARVARAGPLHHPAALGASRTEVQADQPRRRCRWRI